MSFIFSWLTIKKIIPSLRRNLLQLPNKRSSHYKPTPTGGGIVFVSIGGIFSSLLGNFTPLIIIPLSLVGFLDDLFDINKKVRFSIQIIISYIFLINSSIIDSILKNLNYPLVIFISIFLIFLSVAIINFFNFMDGMDGLLSGCMIIYLLVFSYLHSASLFPLISSLFAFFMWNFPPAKIFMGDVGSTFLGAILVTCVFSSNDLKEFIALILLASPLLFDSLICVIRRFLNSQNVFQAHKLHLYQRLHQAGWSHLKVSLLYILLTLILSISYIIFGLSSLIILSLLLIPLGIFLERNYAFPFLSE